MTITYWTKCNTLIQKLRATNTNLIHYALENTMISIQYFACWHCLNYIVSALRRKFVFIYVNAWWFWKYMHFVVVVFFVFYFKSWIFYTSNIYIEQLCERLLKQYEIVYLSIIYTYICIFGGSKKEQNKYWLAIVFKWIKQ